MNAFWKNEKYQSPRKFPKEKIIKELHLFMKPFAIKELPSFSSLKRVFKDRNREAFIKNIEDKAKKSRKRFWQHNKFDEKLIEKIKSKDNPEELHFWTGVFLEYYRALTSKNKND